MKETEKTPYPELDTVLETYATKLQEVLENNFVGMYLQGSLAIGDFDLSSDIDFIVVTKDDLTAKEVAEIQDTHTHTYSQNNRWVKRFEYSFFPVHVFNQHSSPYTDGKPTDLQGRALWYFDHGSPTIERSDHCNTLVTRWTVREKGKTLLGPDPATLIEPIPAANLRKEIKETLIGWGHDLLENPEPYRNRFYQSYLVLNYARMLHDLHAGKIRSKLAGMHWAKAHLDPQWIDLIDFCWKERQDTLISVKQPTNAEVFEQSLAFVTYVVEQGKQYEIR
jgi:predicted nucleotidyltransferase